MSEHDQHCTACDHGIEEMMRLESEMIEKHGHLVRGVGGTEPIICYTIGLWEQGLPELVISGLRPEIATAILNAAVEEIRSSGLPAIGSVTNEIANLPAKWGAVSIGMIEEHMGGALNRINALNSGGLQMTIPAMPSSYPSPVLQVIWCDREGLFPDDDGFDESFRDRQTIFEKWTTGETVH